MFLQIGGWVACGRGWLGVGDAGRWRQGEREERGRWSFRPSVAPPGRPARSRCSARMTIICVPARLGRPVG